MAYFNVCPKCGAHLDPGEPCDCNQKKMKPRRRSCTGATGGQ